MLGFIIAFWSAPAMSLRHPQFAVITTGCVFFGVWIDKRELANALGAEDRAYRQKTPTLITAIRKPKRKDSFKPDAAWRAMIQQQPDDDAVRCCN